MSIKVTDNSKIFIKGLEKLRLKAINTKPLMLQIAEDMKSKVNMRFRHSKDPNGIAGEPLKETTIARRKNNSSKPLIDNGTKGGLMGSIHSEFTDNVAIVGTDKVYAAMQNFGAKRGELGITSVEETVRAHQRRRRKTNEMADVRQHRRTRRVASPWGDVPARRFIGFSNNQRRDYATLIKKYLKGDK